MLSNCNMEFHSDCCDGSNGKKTSRSKTCISPQANQRNKLGSILNFEKCERNYDDFHPQVLKNAEKSEGFFQKQVEKQFCKSEEIVRYMSCLPSYLEREEKPQEKPLNIGVLDWRLLQKWQHNNNDVIGTNDEHSPSTSNATWFFSSRGTSSYCSSENAWSYLQQKINYPSSPTEGYPSGTKLPAGNAGEFLDSKNGSNDLLKVHVDQSSLQATLSSNLGTVNRLTDSKNEDQDLHKLAGTRSQPPETDGVITDLKGNGMIHKGEASKAKEQVLRSSVTDRDFSERCKTAVPELRNNPRSSHFAVGHQSDSSKGDNSRSLEEDWYTYHVGCREKACHAKSRSDHSRFYSVASERCKTKDSEADKSFPKETRNLNCPTGKEQTMQCTERVSISPSRRRYLEKDSGPQPGLAENENFQKKMSISQSTKARNPSPTRRFSFGVGRIGKSSNSNSSVTVNLVSENIPDSKVTSTPYCSKYSTTQKSNATSRARSSPLRRLLDPIFKAKGVDSRDFARSFSRNPLKTDKTLKSSNGQIESPVLHSVKGGGRTDDFGGLHHTQKNKTSSIQALLQVTLNNGLPVFTFTVDNCTDIFAATVKELSSNKTVRRWIYTFFSFSEMKKKNAHWINQGRKDKNQGYVSNIIAQMKVSDSLYADSTRERYAGNSNKREFILSSVGARDMDQTTDSLPGNELAAIVVKLPERVGQLDQEAQHRDTFNKQSLTGLHDEAIESFGDDIFSTTVILPSGNHGVPSKGEPSPLIERWKSGGSCDCGGWDLGCQLRILANSNESNQRLKSTKSGLNAFKLFSQEEVDEERPMFVLSPFEDGIFSIEFNSSLEFLQAFSISIAVLQSQTSAILSSKVFKDKMSEETTAPENTVSKICKRAQVEVSAKYVANPPLSPVGRL